MSLSTKVVLFLVANSFLFSKAAKNNPLLQDPAVDDNPDTYLPPTKIIRRHGYPSESHIVQSEDGYLLELHRIPHGKEWNPSEKKKTPVLMHHGILSCSMDWIVNGPEKSLGYLLADRGYDIWMGNARGNTFSRSHVWKNPDDEPFWNFSFHENGVFDLPAVIDYILNMTGSDQLIYVGHSMGTTMFYVMCSERPEYTQKIKFHVGLGPVAYLTHTTSVIRYLIPYARKIQKLSEWYTKGAYLEHDFLLKTMAKLLCGREIFNTNICEQYIIFSLFGKDPREFNQSLLPVILNHAPAGTSGKTLIHYSQMYSADKFQYFDYGLSGNIKMYNRTTPPLYDLSKVAVPSILYYGKNDIVADYRDVTALYKKLPKPMSLIEVPYDKFNHIDFLISIDCNRLLNNQLLDFINKTETPGFIEEQIERAIKERSTWNDTTSFFFSPERSHLLEFGTASDMPLREYQKHASKHKVKINNDVNRSKRNRDVDKILQETRRINEKRNSDEWNKKFKDAMDKLNNILNNNPPNR